MDGNEGIQKKQTNSQLDKQIKKADRKCTTNIKGERQRDRGAERCWLTNRDSDI